MFNTLFYICDNIGFLKAMSLIKTALTIIKFVIPIALIIWISIDLFKNMVNPDNKDGIKKIGIRLGAALIVFLLPTIVTGVLNIFDNITGNNDYKVSKCYTNADSQCINNINAYLNCDDQKDEDKAKCREYRTCNSYTLDNSCTVHTELNDNDCHSLNLESGNYKFYR